MDRIRKIEMVKVIANTYAAQFRPDDTRSADEIHAHMREWALRGWLTIAFIKGCWDAIYSGKEVRISWNPDGKGCYGYLAGSAEDMAALGQIDVSKVKITNPIPLG